MTATKTPPPNLDEKLREAAAEAEQYRTELAQAEADLTAAIEAEDFKAADTAKARAEAVRPHLALAEASREAFAGALRHLQQHEQAAKTAAAEQARRQAAEAALGAAMTAENEARETAERHFLEAVAGVEAVRQSLLAARQAEQAGQQARYDVNQARADLSGGVPAQNVVVNYVASRIERDAVLLAIVRGWRTP